MFVEWKTVAALAPEMTLILAATALFVAAAFSRNRNLWFVAALGGYVLAAAEMLFGTSAEAQPLVSGPVVIDELAQAFRALALLTGFLLTCAASRRTDERLAGEVFGSIMLATTGIMITSCANELVLLFLGLELISIPTYVLLFLGRRDAASGEATMKYFFLSVLSSAILLYGFSFLYGIGGTTLIAGTEQFPGIRDAVLRLNGAGGEPAAMIFAPFAVILITAGLAFKLAAVPFHFYAPDVYQGTTNVNAALLAVAPKIAGLVGAIRLLLVALSDVGQIWQLILVLSIVTMTIGNVCALWQTNLRRMMAYSSIAHAGYLLIGLAAAAVGPAGNADGGPSSVVIYMIVYSLASLGAFAALAAIGGVGRDVSTLSDVSGLAKTRPAMAAAIAICMFSLAGLPPLAGFWGKFSLMFGAMWLSVSAFSNEAGASGVAMPGIALWFGVLSIVGVLNAAVAAAYYLRVIGAMYFQPSAGEMSAEGGRGPQFAALFCAAALLAGGLCPGPLLNAARKAENQLPRLARSAPATAEHLAAQESQ